MCKRRKKGEEEEIEKVSFYKINCWQAKISYHNVAKIMSNKASKDDDDIRK